MTADSPDKDPEGPEDTSRLLPALHPNWVTGEGLARTAPSRPINGLAATVASIAILVLIGWTFGVEPLKRLAPGLTAMNPLTAVSFLAIAAAIALLNQVPVRRPQLASALGGAVALVGALKLMDLTLGTTLCPDDVLFRSKLADGQGFPSRLPQNTAVCLVLIGLGIVGTDRPNWWRWAHPQILVLPIVGISLAAIVGYLYDTSGFYRAQQYIPMALHTAANYGLASIALALLRPSEGVLRLVPRKSLGARTLLRLLPWCIFVPLLLGALELGGAKAGWFSAETGASITAVTLVITMSLLAFIDAVALNAMERRRQQAVVALRARVEEDRRALGRAQALADLEDRIRIARGRLVQAAPEILSMIVRRAGAQQAVLFRTVDEDDGPQLEVIAAYAYDGPQQVKLRHQFGEGLAGQCALDRQARTIEPVPETYFRVRSGGHEGVPRRIDLLPILVDDECVGVLELASLGAPDPDAERYLRAVLRPLAFALYRDVDRYTTRSVTQTPATTS
ncbi:MAG TPA: GAF domain-containing protein [Nevskiaceae bacterium]|nr:GAF domain-containing protein [Nevskiaceae bacterium]